MSCLQFLIQHIGEELPDYLLCVAPPKLTTPLAQGALFARPREYFMLARRDVHKFPSAEAFCAHVQGVAGELLPRIAALQTATSFVEGLCPGVRAAHAPFQPCGCTVKLSCPRHLCGCGKRVCKCAWRSENSLAWGRSKQSSASQPYFRYMWEQVGIDVGQDIKSHRKRDLLNVTFALRGVEACIPNGVLDTSQSLRYSQFRGDGKLPTLAVSSELYSMGLGRMLDVSELFGFMGFPPNLELHGFSPRRVVGFLGNTMHVDVVGTLMGVLLASRL